MNSSLDSIIKQFLAAYPNSQATDETVLQYVRLLRDIPLDELQVVVDQVVAESKFLPTIAEIRQRHRLLTRTLGTASAEEAWRSVVKAISSEGRGVRPSSIFAGHTLAAVQTMGWKTLCDSDNPVADRAHFMKIYDAIVERGDQVDRLLPQAERLVTERQGKVTSVAKMLEDKVRNGR